MATIESIRLLTVKGQSQGLDKVEQDLGRVAAAQKQVGDASTVAAQAFETSSRRQISAAGALDRLSKQIDQTYRAQQGLSRGQAVLDRAMQQGLLSAEQYSQKLGLLHQRFTVLPQANDNISRSITQQIAAFNGLGASVTNVTGIVGRFFPMLSGLASASAVVNSVNLAARYDTLGVVLHQVGKNAGYTAQEMDRYAAAVQRSGITMTEARNTVTRMTQAQLDLSKSSQLARVAQDAAVIGNTNSSDALERMVVGIQSAQVEILRGIGLNVNFEQSYATLARSLGKTTNDLTEIEKSQARFNVVLQAGTQIQGTYAASLETPSKQLSSMSRIVEDMALQFGQKLMPAYTLAVKSAGSALALLANNLDLVSAALAIVAARAAAPMIVSLATSFLTASRNCLTFVGGLNTVNASLLATTARARALSLVMATLTSPVAWVTAIGAGLAIWALRTDSATRAMEEHQRIIGDVKAAYDAAGGSVELWGTELKNVTSLQIQAQLRTMQEEFQKSVARMMNQNIQANISVGQVDMFPAVSELLRQLRDGQIKVQDFRQSLNQLGEADAYLRPLATSLLNASREAQTFEKGIQEMESALRIARNEANATDAAIQGVGNGAARATGQVISFSDALKTLRAFDPKLAAEQKISDDVTKARSALNSALASSGVSGSDSGASGAAADVRAREAYDNYRNAVNSITGLTKAQEELDKVVQRNATNSLPEQARKLAEINQQYDTQKKNIEQILNRPEADRSATQALLQQTEQQRQIALANARRDAAEKAAKSGDKNDEFDSMVKRIEDQTRKLDEQATTFGKTAAEIARHRAEQELLTAAQRAGLQVTPQLSAQIADLAEKNAQAATRLDEARKTQAAFNDTLEGFASAGYDMFDGLISGTKSWNDALNDATKSIMRMVVQAALLGQGPFAGMMGLAPGSGQTTGGLFGALGSMFQFHDGGLVGYGGTPRYADPAIFYNAPRFHDGLRPDEVPAILQKGEYVLSRADLMAINAGKSAVSAPAAAVVNDNRKSGPPIVNVYGAPSEPDVTHDEDGSLSIIFEENEKWSAARMARGRGSLAKTAGTQRHLRG